MSRIWRRFVDALRPQPLYGDDPFPPRRRPAPQPVSENLPNTFRAFDHIDGVRPRLFDPALLHFRSAFRPGDPALPDEVARVRWASLRRSATDYVLRRVAESAHGGRLVLRGSRPVRAWVGADAREPGDLDFVVDPPGVDRATRWDARLTDAVFAGAPPAGVAFDRAAVAADDIWAYDRAPGRRLVFPWRADGLPGGAVQVDVVAGEPLHDPPRREHVPAADGGCVGVRAATPAQALAWKLLWLATDMHPQGKDLYDAVLLAERFPLPAAVLTATIADLAVRREAIDGLQGEHWASDWHTFQAEYPWVDGEEGEWRGRLAAALAPLRADVYGYAPPVPRPTPPACDPRWRTSTVVGLADGIAEDGDFGRLPILADALEEAGCDDGEWLAHLRAGGPHAGGCAVVDRLRAAPRGG